MKKIFALLFLFTFTLTYAHSQVSLSIDPDTAVPGTNIIIPVNADFSEAENGIGSLTVIINYDNTVLTEFVGFSNATDSLPGIAAIPIGGGILISWVDLDSDNVTKYAGKLLDLEFFYSEGFTALTFNTASSIITDINGNPFPNGEITYVNGSVQLEDVFVVTLSSDPSEINALLSGDGPYSEGESVTIEAGSVDYFTFTGWTGNEDDLGLLTDVAAVTNTFDMPDRDISFVANYEQEMFDLTIDIVGGGEVKVDDVTYADPMMIGGGVTVTLTAHPSSSWLFAGWDGDAAGTETSTLLFMDAAKTLTATFTEIIPDTFALTLNNNPASLGAVLTGQGFYEEDEPVQITASPVDGYRFDGWTGSLQDVALLADASATTTTLNMPDRAVELTANYVRQVSLTVNITGSGEVRVNNEVYAGPLTFDAGTLLTLSALAMEGWRFDNWSGDVTSNNSPYQVTINDDLAVTATFVEIVGPPEEYTLTITIVGAAGGSVQINGNPYAGPVTVTEGTLLALQYFANEGWQFDGWSGDLTGNVSPAFVTMNSNKNITATFSEIPEPVFYTLDIDIEGQGNVRVNGNLYTSPLQLEEGTAVNLVAEAANGWEFESWTGDHAGTLTSLSFTMNGDKNITASFSEIPPVQVTLSIVIAGEGQVTVNGEAYDGAITVDIGTNLTLAAIADEGWQFDGWSGDQSGSLNPVNVVMNGDKEITATFTMIPIPQYTLEIVVSGEGSVLVNGSTYTAPLTFDEGTNVTLIPVAGEGWAFDRWNGSMASEDAEINIVMNADKTVTAFFEEIPDPTFTLTFAIKDQANNPLTNATITLNSIAYPAGIYVFGGLQPGTYNYQVAKPGYFSIQGSVQIINTNMTIDIILRLDDTSAEPSGLTELRIFPNPASSIIVIESDQPVKELRLMNTVGQELLYLQGHNQEVLEVNVSDLKPGIYLMQIKLEEGLITRKIQVAH